jgi:hypothetical protein
VGGVGLLQRGEGRDGGGEEGGVGLLQRGEGRDGDGEGEE